MLAILFLIWLVLAIFIVRFMGYCANIDRLAWWRILLDNPPSS